MTGVHGITESRRNGPTLLQVLYDGGQQLERVEHKLESTKRKYRPKSFSKRVNNLDIKQENSLSLKENY